MSKPKCKKGFIIENDELKEEIKKLETKSLTMSLIYIVTIWSAIIGTALLSICAFQQFGINFFTILLYILVNIFIGSRQKALESLIHEATHFHLCRNIHLNDFIAYYFLALPMCHDFIAERHSHVYGHHQQFWDSKDDPDFIRYKDMGLDQFPADSKMHFIKIICKAFPSYVLDSFRTLIWHSNRTKYNTFNRVVYFSLVFYGFYSFGYLRELLMYWFIPFSITLTCIRYIMELSEHLSLDCEDEFVSTRNNIGFFNELLIHPCGDAYHIIHHILPRVPFYNLKKAHDILMANHKTYAEKGRHCYGIFFHEKGKQSSMSDLIKSSKESEK